MVDIIIGPVTPTGPPVNKPAAQAAPVEAELLNVREPRNRINPTDEERRKEFRQDPAGGRVLTLLVPKGMTLPKDLDGRRYKVLLRFMKK